MPLEFWKWLWIVVLLAGIGLFAALATVVTIGGAYNIRSLFRSLREEHARNLKPNGDEDQANKT